MGRATIGNQSSHRLTCFCEDNLMAFLDLFDERGELSFGLGDVAHQHDEILTDQIWSAYGCKSVSLYARLAR